ncbi:hypothetical protein A2U01_0063496, partial [Trifolium medium]|nr:hypothetical protein [Trifolium medium]
NFSGSATGWMETRYRKVWEFRKRTKCLNILEIGRPNCPTDVGMVMD